MERWTYTPNTAQGLSISRLKNDHVKAMANTVSCRGYSSDTSTNNCNLGSAKPGTRIRRLWGEDLGDTPLEQLEYEQKRMKKGVSGG